jgi:hypothetical protein
MGPVACFPDKIEHYIEAIYEDMAIKCALYSRLLLSEAIPCPKRKTKRSLFISELADKANLTIILWLN